MALRVGVEIGGTFTDLVAFRDGGVQVAKVPSTPASPDIGAFDAIQAAGLSPADMADLGHGSTVATNAVLERKGARVAFVTTAGFRDILFLQRHDRRNIYDLHYRKPAPVVRRADCFEVAERVLADGAVETPLDEAAVTGRLAAIEAHLAVVSQALGIPYAPPQSGGVPAEVVALVRAGRRLDAIKAYRAATGAGEGMTPTETRVAGCDDRADAEAARP